MDRAKLKRLHHATHSELDADQAFQVFVGGAYQLTVTDSAASLTDSVSPVTVQAEEGLQATVS